MRAVSVLEVAQPELWATLETALGVAPIGEVLGPRRRVIPPEIEARLGELREQGIDVLVRHARIATRAWEVEAAALPARLGHLSDASRAVLHRAQRHAVDGVVRGIEAWDPEGEQALVDELLASGLVQPLDEDFRRGRHRLHPDLPPPVLPVYDFAEALMPLTDDLKDPGTGVVPLLHDMAALSAALEHHQPRRTLAGGLDKNTTRRLGKWLGSAELASAAAWDDAPRWGRALRALEALGAVEMDPRTRTLYVEPLLEGVLEGSAVEATERLVERLIAADLRMALPAVRAALHQAGEGAVDEMIFLEELEDQHREVIFTPWYRAGQALYPLAGEDHGIPWTLEAFEKVEGRLIDRLLRLLSRLGLIRRAPGVFAATVDGRAWAAGQDVPGPPIWVSSDLELTIPPGSITPWERYQLERLGRCLSRDVVDRYRLERRGLELWLRDHELEDALALLRRRSPGLSPGVVDLLEQWAASATRFVLTRGVLLGAIAAPHV